MSKITEIELPSGEILSLAEEQIYVGDTEPTDENIELFMDTSENDFIPFGLTKAKSYSTEEKIVGTWIDGKPIYTKTVNLGSQKVYGEMDNVYDFSNLNIERVIDLRGSCHTNSITEFKILPFPHGNSGGVIGVQLDSNFRLGFRCGGWYTSSNSITNIIITIQYTKTTDTATNTPIEATLHRYDGEEKIVGTWFGKPLYEKIAIVSQQVALPMGAYVQVNVEEMPLGVSQLISCRFVELDHILDVKIAKIENDKLYVYDTAPNNYIVISINTKCILQYTKTTD